MTSASPQPLNAMFDDEDELKSGNSDADVVMESLEKSQTPVNGQGSPENGIDEDDADGGGLFGSGSEDEAPSKCQTHFNHYMFLS